MAADVPETLAVLAQVADAWGADWQPDGASGGEAGSGSGGSGGGSGSGSGQAAGGRLAMPVVAGIRRGFAVGRVNTYPQAAGTRLVYAVEQLHLHLHAASVGVLLFAAFGGLLTVIWPFFPVLLPVAPLGALLALGGWFLVVSRLQNSGPRELLDLLADDVAERNRGEAPGGHGGGNGAEAESGPAPID